VRWSRGADDVLSTIMQITRAAKKELYVMKQLSHDNVNRFIGACIEPGHVSIVTQYCSRGSLRVRPTWLYTIFSLSLFIAKKTNMSVRLIVWPRCTLAKSHTAAWWVTVSMPTGQTDGRTPDRYITLSTRHGQRNKKKHHDSVRRYHIV